MDGPVGATLAVLPGAVEGIDDPDAPGASADAADATLGIGGGLLAQEAVLGAALGECGDEEFVAGAVALVLDAARLGTLREQVLAQREQQVARARASSVQSRWSSALGVGTG